MFIWYKRTYQWTDLFTQISKNIVLVAHVFMAVRILVFFDLTSSSSIDSFGPVSLLRR